MPDIFPPTAAIATVGVYRLQDALADAGIAYAHHRELAPTTELRHLQYREDDRLGVGKRSRVERLADAHGVPVAHLRPPPKGDQS